MHSKFSLGPHHV